jgi:hypothetical protein
MGQRPPHLLSEHLDGPNLPTTSLASVERFCRRTISDHEVLAHKVRPNTVLSVLNIDDQRLEKHLSIQN